MFLRKQFGLTPEGKVKMRPLKNKLSKEARRFWAIASKSGAVKTFEENEVFRLSKEEAKKCRFKITNQAWRLAECTVHTGNFSHGIRLFPPHLWDLRNGKVYHRENEKAKWKRWLPNYEPRK